MHREQKAVISKEGDTIIKDRIPKQYRHPLLDLQLRESRTRREANILRKLPVPGPKFISADKSRIEMSFLPGRQVKEVLDVNIAVEIGKQIAQLHDANIVHGDLTTSNMLYQEGVQLIDFGLSFREP